VQYGIKTRPRRVVLFPNGRSTCCLQNRLTSVQLWRDDDDDDDDDGGGNDDGVGDVGDV